MTNTTLQSLEAWGLRILLVEDVDMIAQVVEFLVQRAGCEFFRATNGEEGLHMATELRPDLILMDLQMPVMDGVEAVQRLRAWEAEQAAAGSAQGRMPVYAFTAKCGPGQEMLCLEKGFDGFFCKPLPVREFFDLVKKIGTARRNQSAAPEAG